LDRIYRPGWTDETAYDRNLFQPVRPNFSEVGTITIFHIGMPWTEDTVFKVVFALWFEITIGWFVWIGFTDKTEYNELFRCWLTRLEFGVGITS
jgi:hypothetical protein